MSRYLLIFSGVEVFSFDTIQTIKSFVSQNDPNSELIVEVYDKYKKVFINLWTSSDDYDETDWEKEGF